MGHFGPTKKWDTWDQGRKYVGPGTVPGGAVPSHGHPNYCCINATCLISSNICVISNLVFNKFIGCGYPYTPPNREGGEVVKYTPLSNMVSSIDYASRS